MFTAFPRLPAIAPGQFGRLKNAPVLLAALSLGACASVSVKDVQHSSQGRPGRAQGAPRHITVIPFSVEAGSIAAGRSRGSADPQALAGEVRQSLSAELVRELSKSIAPASLAGNALPAAGPDSWLVSGRITRISPGNRLLRMSIGLGAGGTKLETQVEVRRASPGNPPFLSFATTGGSNATPGAVTNPIPYSALPSAMMGAKAGLADDTARTARMITATLADHLVEQGWMAPGKVPNAKRQRP